MLKIEKKEYTESGLITFDICGYIYALVILGH